MHTLKLWLVVVTGFVILDLVWLGIIMKGFYSQELGDLARRQGTALAPRWAPALVVYVLIPTGLVLFVRPVLGAQAPLGPSFVWGALFGLVLYGVYDLTNLAILDRWSTRMTLADMAWGAALCGTVAVLMRVVDRWLAE